MSDQVIVSDAGPIRTVRMNRPEKKNALTLAMYDAMARAISDGPPDLRCIVIAGVSGAFSAGNDLAEFRRGTDGLATPILNFLHAIARCETPLVAAVQGLAVGVGCTMLLHCDHVVAATNARFSTPFVSLGLVPEAASSLLVPRLMGHSRAFSLLVMGQPLDVHHAQACGLVNTVTHPDDVEDTAQRTAREIAALPREAVHAARRLLRGPPEEIIKRIDEEAAIFKQRLASPEAKAAFEAFLTRQR